MSPIDLTELIEKERSQEQARFLLASPDVAKLALQYSKKLISLSDLILELIYLHNQVEAAMTSLPKTLIHPRAPKYTCASCENDATATYSDGAGDFTAYCDDHDLNR